MSHVSTLVMHRDAKDMTALYKARKEMYKARTGFLRMLWRWTKRVGLGVALYTYVSGWGFWKEAAADLLWSGVKYKVMMFFN